ncbi:hypothetical protein BDQ17DRAFT_1426808 [Cyathus striatus]|nr:hypothetical protein BDQ17DRAFT_1426808 [Cyathus striatus]
MSYPASEEPQAPSPHIMKMTNCGRPLLKDTLNLFATLIVSLLLTPHMRDKAVQNLASLEFYQLTHGPDPREPLRVIKTMTTEMFSMTHEMAKATCQPFLYACLIMNPADDPPTTFKEPGVYQLTPKGLHVLECFISKNGINYEHLHPVFSSQPICTKLLHLERHSVDDEIIVTQSVFPSSSIYKITNEGRCVAHWNASGVADSVDGSVESSAENMQLGADAKLY